MRTLLGFFGGHRNPATLSQRDWDRFIRERRSGRIGPSGKPVANTTIAADLTFLITVLNWATRSRDEQGTLLLQSNPLKGLKKPVEKNPRRVIVTEQEYKALLRVSLELDWRIHVALVLAHETGHRIGAIRKLRWPDIDLECRAIRWRAEHEKTGYGHVTPATAEAIAALEQARKRNRGIGDAPVLPHTKDPSKCVTASITAKWWRKAREARRPRTEARQGLALPQAEIRLGHDGSAARGPLPTRRLERHQDRAQMLPAGRRRPAP